VADLAARILAAALLESDDGAVLALLDDLGGNRGAIDERRAERDVLALAMGQHLADLDDFADLGLELLDLEQIVGGNAVLLAARFDDCEHFLPFAVRSALMNRFGRFGRLFVSLRVQKTSGAEDAPRRLRAVPTRWSTASQGKRRRKPSLWPLAVPAWAPGKPHFEKEAGFADGFGLVTCPCSRYLVRRAGNGRP